MTRLGTFRHAQLAALPALAWLLSLSSACAMTGSYGNERQRKTEDESRSVPLSRIRETTQPPSYFAQALHAAIPQQLRPNGNLSEQLLSVDELWDDVGELKSAADTTGRMGAKPEEVDQALAHLYRRQVNALGRHLVFNTVVDGDNENIFLPLAEDIDEDSDQPCSAPDMGADVQLLQELVADVTSAVDRKILDIDGVQLEAVSAESNELLLDHISLATEYYDRNASLRSVLQGDASTMGLPATCESYLCVALIFGEVDRSAGRFPDYPTYNRAAVVQTGSSRQAFYQGAQEPQSQLQNLAWTFRPAPVEGRAWELPSRPTQWEVDVNHMSNGFLYIYLEYGLYERPEASAQALQ